MTSRMTLQRRFLLHNLLLVVVMIAAGTLAVWRLNLVTQRINLSRSVYSEMRTIGNVAVYVGTIQGLASDPTANRALIEQHLANAIGGLDQFIQVGQGYGDGDIDVKRAYVPIDASAEKAREKLASVLKGLRNNSTNSESMRRATAAALADIDDVAGSCIRFISNRQQNAAGEMVTNVMLIGILSLVAILAAVMLSVWQYRIVMAPLSRLRAGVQQIASTQFSDTLDPATMGKSPEFAELASEFNRMAQQLCDFYKNLEEQVRTKSQQLVRSERLASVGFLAAGVAHEINNPLNIISGYAEITSRRLGPAQGMIDSDAADQARENLRIIREEAFRCKDITEKLLSLSRNSAESREDFDLAAVARDVAMMTQGLKNYRDRRLTVRLDPGQPLEVRANLNEMKQVLLNLTINALEAISPEKGEVCIEGRRENGWVELSVRDNGRGMTRDVLEHVFEPFFTTRKNGERGTGLGLSITHAIVESHNGRIEAHSDGLGCGAQFTVRLPEWRS